MIADYLEEESQSPSIRRRLLIAFHEACLTYEKKPDSGKRVEIAASRHRAIRQAPIRGFVRYLIFYRRIEGGISIKRVLHGMRNLPLLLDDPDER
jgi:plasmid stabilization system protein ParE